MHNTIDRLARWIAQLGGLVLASLIILTCASVLGRSISTILYGDFFQNRMPGLADTLLATGVGPINGDFEIVEAGMAFAIFAFLPVCQLTAAHASVDVFTSHLSDRFNRVIRAIVDVVFAAVLILIAVQLFKGMTTKMNANETTLLLQFPIWWSYAASVAAASVGAVIAVYVAAMRIAELVTGHSILPEQAEASH